MKQKSHEKAVEVVESYFREVFNGHNKIQDSYEWDKAKKCAGIDIEREISLVRSVIELSVDVHQTTDTPKKLCIDILNPLLQELESVRNEIEKL